MKMCTWCAQLLNWVKDNMRERPKRDLTNHINDRFTQCRNQFQDHDGKVKTCIRELAEDLWNALVKEK